MADASMFAEDDVTEDGKEENGNEEEDDNNENENEEMNDSSATEMDEDEDEAMNDYDVNHQEGRDEKELDAADAAVAVAADDNKKHTNDDSWRLREMGDTILFADRPTIDPAVGPPWRRFTAASVDKIRLPGVGVVQKSFDAAAATVLRALLSSSTNNIDHEQDKQHLLPSTTMSSDNQESWRKHLPDEFAKVGEEVSHHRSTTLSNLRIAALQHVWAARGESVGTTIIPAVAVSGHSGKKTSAAITTTSVSSPPPTTTTTTTTMSTIRQFTRNTPASTAASLDARLHHGRAVLAAAANLVAYALTPGDDTIIDPLYGLTSKSKNRKDDDNDDDDDDSSGSSGAANRMVHNWAAVVAEAQTHAERCLAVTENAIRRTTQRIEYRIMNASYDLLRRRKLPFSAIFSSTTLRQQRPELSSYQRPPLHWYEPRTDAHTHAWQTTGLPRFRQILEKGMGHAIFYDVHWSTRHGRIASVLDSMVLGATTNDEKNSSNCSRCYGPHLILTTTPDVELFCREFPVRFQQPEDALFAVAYCGTDEQRTNLRREFGTPLGLSESSIQVVVVSIQNFYKDYLHFCQVPWHTVIVDDGVPWMCASKDGDLATLWDTLFSSSDHHVGLAGTMHTIWDYTTTTTTTTTTKSPASTSKDALLIGLTARHRILTASSLSLVQSSHRNNSQPTIELVPVDRLLQFILPNFISCVKEEWDRSKIVTDVASMKHFRKLVARSVVVHQEDPKTENDVNALVLNALTGKVPPEDVSNDERGLTEPPQIFSDEEFCSEGRFAFSKKNNLLWLGPQESSWLRYELGSIDFAALMETIKVSADRALSTCEEITTASSTTSSGATGQVAGSMAYRCAVRCGRHFGSEQGLRQHINAHHAPAGTWLCRTCFVDCVTSQARTHHERTCGQPVASTASNNDAAGTSVGATPTVGQGGGAKKVAPKKSKSSTELEKENDADGSRNVAGYRGVWVNRAGKHFVKVGGKPIYNKEADGKNLLLFATADEAAKKYDAEMRSSSGKSKAVELNFKDDGSRIVYDEEINALATSLGGSAANVVPALSVINIKDLPSDVKPLLRDPRQTSRTGGNSKRHIYAYRGVCRQARKGHDRWQSQISFMGVNHYLGTFDSEWDAAAIYAWAHLILYGEEATRQAQREGEEAAAAYEQEKLDIAEGKIPEPPAKPEKKKKPPAKKKKVEKVGSADEATPKKRKPRETSTSEKKPRGTGKVSKAEKELMAPLLSKGMTRAPVVSPILSLDRRVVADKACKKAKLAKEAFYFSTTSAPPTMRDCIRPCLPQRYSIGRALLLGLSPSHYGWDLKQFCERQASAGSQEAMAMLQMLAVEYDDDGLNEKFSSIIQGTFCIIGNASTKMTQMFNLLGLGTIPLGGSVGSLDCHIGGVPGSCTERAACVRYDEQSATFQFCCLAPTDHVTVNGNTLSVEEGFVTIRHMDVCSVGPRVFAFLCQ